VKVLNKTATKPGRPEVISPGSVMSVNFRSLGTIKPTHYATPSAIGGADLLSATGNSK
jgi:hypothetical protein